MAIMETSPPNLAPRSVSESRSEMTQIVLPNDTNPLRVLLGGRLMHWIDLAGALAAHRHSRAYVVTASVDHLDFFVSCRVGDVVVLRSQVNRAFTTSMEIGVKVFVESYIEQKIKHVRTAYLTFVAVDGDSHRLRVPPLIPETDEDKRRFEDAMRRRTLRDAERARQKLAKA